MKNKDINRSHISEKKIREVVGYFALDFTATNISKLSGVSRVSINKLLGKNREKILLFLLSKRDKLKGEF